MLKNMTYRYLFLGIILILTLSLIAGELLWLPSIYIATISGDLALYAFPLVWFFYYFRKHQIAIKEWLKPVQVKLTSINIFLTGWLIF